MAVRLESVMDCFGNPLKARILILLRDNGPMSAKQILSQDHKIPPASLYRALKSMEKEEILVTVSETKVRAVVEKTLYFNKALTESIEDEIDGADGDRYCRLFMGFAFNLLRRFEAYANSGYADFKRDKVGFMSVPIYATPGEMEEYANMIMEVLRPGQTRASEEQELRNVALIMAPPFRDEEHKEND